MEKPVLCSLFVLFFVILRTKKKPTGSGVAVQRSERFAKFSKKEVIHALRMPTASYASGYRGCIMRLVSIECKAGHSLASELTISTECDGQTWRRSHIIICKI